MDALGIVLIVVVVIVVAGVLSAVAANRRRPVEVPNGDGAAAGEAGTAIDFERPRPPLADFHVEGTDANVYFDVPLPESVDDVLQSLLLRDAVDVLFEKRAHGLPLDQIERVVAYGRGAGGEFAKVGSIDLEEPGVLPQLDAPDLVPHAAVAGFDPLAELGQQQLASAPGLADVSREEGLPPIGAELRLTGKLEAGLRALGVDPATMMASELALALLKIGGYRVVPGDKPDTHIASRGGSRTYLKVVDHQPGSYPELDESKINEFIIGFGSVAADRGLLVTDKYGPFLIYDKERRDPTIKFITRERLQAFVDSFGIS